MLHLHLPSCAVCRRAVKRCQSPLQLNFRGRRNVLVACSAFGVDRRPEQLVALKEWAITVSALGDGLQTVLVRKGGIREPVFKPKHRDFFLFPTAFHSDTESIKEEIARQYTEEFAFDPKKLKILPLKLFAHVSRAWATPNQKLIAALCGLHIWTDDYIASRLNWRKDRPATVMELQCYKVDPPYQIVIEDKIFGCFSWVDLSKNVQGDAKRVYTPVLDDTEFRSRQQQLDEHFASMARSELVSLF